MSCFARRAVRVFQAKVALILSSGLQIQNASRKAFGHCVIQVLAPSIDAFAANSHQRQSVTPTRLPYLSISHRYCRVPIRVAGDGPLEAQVDQSRMFDRKLSRNSAVICPGESGERHREQETVKETIHVCVSVSMERPTLVRSVAGYAAD